LKEDRLSKENFNPVCRSISEKLEKECEKKFRKEKGNNKVDMQY